MLKDCLKPLGVDCKQRKVDGKQQRCFVGIKIRSANYNMSMQPEQSLADFQYVSQFPREEMKWDDEIIGNAAQPFPSQPLYPVPSLPQFTALTSPLWDEFGNPISPIR